MKIEVTEKPKKVELGIMYAGDTFKTCSGIYMRTDDGEGVHDEIGVVNLENGEFRHLDGDCAVEPIKLKAVIDE